MSENPVAGESMPPGKRLVWGLASTWAVQVVGTAAVFGVPVLAPVIAPEMGVDPTLVGVYVAIAYLTGQLTGLMTGGFMDRYGALRMSQVCCLFAALGIVALFSASIWLAPLAALLMGTCYGPLNPTSTKILRGLGAEKRQPLIFSVKQTGVPVAGVIVGMSLPVLTVMFGWRWAFAVFAVIAILVALAIQPVRETFDHDRQRDGGRPKIKIWGPLKLVMGDPALRALSLVGFALAGAQISLGSFYVLYLIDRLEWSLIDAGFLYAVVQAGGIGGRLAWGFVAKQMLSPTVVLVGISVLVCGLFALTTTITSAWPVGGVAGLSLALGLCVYGWNGVWLSEIADAAPGDKIGDATGGAQFIMFGGVTVMPPVFGALIEWTGSYVAPFVAAGIFVVAIALYMAIAVRLRTSPK
ncbi:MAG: MFS transporter [Rhodospirillales bacterium]